MRNTNSSACAESWQTKRKKTPPGVLVRCWATTLSPRTASLQFYKDIISNQRCSSKWQSLIWGSWEWWRRSPKYSMFKRVEIRWLWGKLHMIYIIYIPLKTFSEPLCPGVTLKERPGWTCERAPDCKKCHSPCYNNYVQDVGHFRRLWNFSLTL